MDKYLPEFKEIFDKIDNLTPWDKVDLIKHIVEHEMTEDEIEKYFIEGSGYVKYDDINLVSEIENNNLEFDVLDNMTSSDIADYVYEHDDIMDELFDLMELEDIVSALDNRNKTLKNLLEEINDKTSAITDFVCEKIKKTTE